MTFYRGRSRDCISSPEAVVGKAGSCPGQAPGAALGRVWRRREAAAAAAGPRRCARAVPAGLRGRGALGPRPASRATAAAFLGPNCSLEKCGDSRGTGKASVTAPLPPPPGERQGETHRTGQIANGTHDRAPRAPRGVSDFAFIRPNRFSGNQADFKHQQLGSGNPSARTTSRP